MNKVLKLGRWFGHSGGSSNHKGGGGIGVEVGLSREEGEELESNFAMGRGSATSCSMGDSLKGKACSWNLHSY